MKLLTQGDDYGFTKGVTLGILDAIENGVLRNTGLFTNMHTSAYAAKQISNYPEACFGIDFNIVAGKPISNPSDIPHLVDDQGNFHKSGYYVTNPLYATLEGRSQLFPMDEVYKELKAQYDAFLTLTGTTPGYLHPHSIMPENYLNAIHTISEETHIPYSMDIQEKYGFTNTWDLDNGDFEKTMKTKVFDPMAQINKNALLPIQKHADTLLSKEYVFVGGHPGFVDAALFDLTTLSLERMRDHEMMVSQWLKDWITTNNIELITYRDLI